MNPINDHIGNKWNQLAADMGVTEGNYFSIPENEVCRELEIRKLKYERQYSIGKYFADFYFPEWNVVLEIDGKFHRDDTNQFEHDRERDSYMNKNGYSVVRLSVSYLRENINGVINILRLLPEIKTYFINSDGDVAEIQMEALYKSEVDTK